MRAGECCARQQWWRGRAGRVQLASRTYANTGGWSSFNPPHESQTVRVSFGSAVSSARLMIAALDCGGSLPQWASVHHAQAEPRLPATLRLCIWPFISPSFPLSPTLPPLSILHYAPLILFLKQWHHTKFCGRGFAENYTEIHLAQICLDMKLIK